jgi:CO dehydrogenase maturation factor
MAYSIGLAGKGGTGKTTVAGLLIKYLVEKGKVPVLAVDADANANLNEVLGLEVQETLGDAREEMKKGVAAGMTKDIFMEMKLEQALVEAKGYDLVVMGRPEGPGCYCAANTLLTNYLDRLINNYAFVVVDNEAGMEHISRLTTNNIDLLLIVSDPSRILELTQELPLSIKKKAFLVNQAKENQEADIQKSTKEFGLELSGIIPDDPLIREFDLNGKPTTQLTRKSKAVEAAFSIFEKIL